MHVIFAFEDGGPRVECLSIWVRSVPSISSDTGVRRDNSTHGAAAGELTRPLPGGTLGYNLHAFDPLTGFGLC